LPEYSAPQWYKHDSLSHDWYKKKMSNFICRECAIKKGLASSASTANVTGTSYQVDKYNKHTSAPTNNPSAVSIFDDSSIGNYEGHIATALASGAVEIDSQDRKSFVYTPQKRVGTTYSSGYQRADSAVRVVCPDNPHKIHSYPTASKQITDGRCMNCGGSLTLC